MGKHWKEWQTLFSWAPKSLQVVTCSHEIKRHLFSGRTVMTNLDSIQNSRDVTFPNKVHLVKVMVFPVVMHGCELDHKENWASSNWCFWTVVLEKTLEIKEIKPVDPKGNQSWIFSGSADAEAEATILGSPNGKNWLLGKNCDAGKDWRQEEKGMTEDEMVGWHHRLVGCEFG